jgi:hypothetical protein
MVARLCARRLNIAGSPPARTVPDRVWPAPLIAVIAIAALMFAAAVPVQAQTGSAGSAAADRDTGQGGGTGSQTPDLCAYADADPSPLAEAVADRFLGAQSARPAQAATAALPGGATADLTLDRFATDGLACVRAFVLYADTGQRSAADLVSAPVISLGETEGPGGEVTLRMPAHAGWLDRTADVLVAQVTGPADGRRLAQLHVVQDVAISTKTSALTSAIVLVVGAYLLLAVAVAIRRRGQAGYPAGLLPRTVRCLDPVVITAGHHGRASVSKLQILFFTAIVAGLLAYYLARTWTLSELSTDVLLLLGIAGAGTAAAKLTATSRNRVSFENWTWMEQRKWISATQGRKIGPPDWGELITTAGEFDVYRFQMLVFSLIVGAALLLSGLSGLEDFSIPDSLLGVLGLSQVVYVGGKTVGPPSWSELDKKLSDLRDAEAQVAAAYARDNDCKPQGAGADHAAARKADPEAYTAFEQAEQSARAMVTLLYGLKRPAAKLQPQLPELPPCQSGGQSGGQGGGGTAGGSP